MYLHTLKPAPGSKKTRKRIGRGAGSGLGETSGRGHKGAYARSGTNRKHGHEGGQMPLYRRLPKWGFTNIFKIAFQVVNVGDLAQFDAGEVTSEMLKKAGLISQVKSPTKILGNGTVEKKYVVKATAFSKSAIAKLEAVGGKAEVTA